MNRIFLFSYIFPYFPQQSIGKLEQMFQLFAAIIV